MITSGVVCREFIGRRFELDFLIGRVKHARADRGSTILIKGDAGIGKSRLLREFVGALAPTGITPITGQCYEFGDAPYAPLLEIAEALGAASAIAALQSQAVDGAIESGRERMRRFAAFATALAEYSRAKTVVAIIENLHWADIATLELFRYLAGSLKEHHFVLLATLRNEEIATAARATHEMRSEIERCADATIRLQALNPAEMRLLLTSAMRDDGRRVSPVVLQQIAELSDGRPFHAEELLRGMLDRSTDETEAGSSIPPSLGAAVHDRLQSLDDSDRTVLAYAAVIGRRFDAAFLAELAGKPLPGVLLTLRRARNLQLIVEESEGSDFLFRHQLTREVVYEEILLAEARALHRRIAEELQTRSDVEASAVAYHAWRSGNRSLTVKWNEAAGDAAAAIFAHTDAYAHYERAYDAAAAADTRMCLAQKMARALYAVGDLEGAANWFAATVAAATDSGDFSTSYAAALDRALALWEHGSVEAGIAAAIAVTQALARDDSPLRYRAETLTASLLTATSRPQQALSHLDAASSLVSAPEPAWQLRHRGIRAHTLARLGRLAESEADFAVAVAGARKLGDREQLVRTLNNWADVRVRIGDLRGARHHYGDALDVARDLRSSRLTAWLIANNAYTSLFLGDLTTTRALLAEFREIDHDIEIVWIQAQAVLYRLATLTGDETLLRSAKIDQAIERAVALGDRNVLALAAGAVLTRSVLIGEDATALAGRTISLVAGAADIFWFTDAIARAVPVLIPRAREMLGALAADPDSRSAQAHLLLFDARVALREKRRPDADALAQRAIGAFKALGWSIEEAYSREVRGNIKDAVDAFARIGAAAEITRLTTVDERMPRRRGETTLTNREREIARLIGAGKSNRDAADELVISERTVETHVASVYQKLGVGSRRELIALLNSGSRTL